MLSVQEALSLVLAEAQPKPPTRVALGESLGLVLAEDVTSDVDSPPHDKSIVDGYAVRSRDLATGLSEFDVIEEITAGSLPTKSLAAGQASRVMTGAPIPAGADAMVMVEATAPTKAGDRQRVRVLETDVEPGQNIVRRGESLRGDVVLHAGRELRSIEIGVLAEVGRVDVSVVGRPVVAVLPTGNELVDVGLSPAPGQIRNSNGPMLAAAVEQRGGAAVELGIARDDPAEIERLVSEGLSADILLISGGVSAGVLDLVPGVLARLGVERVLHKINLKPGKPLWFGVLRCTAPARLVFGLPGNPVSSLVCFELFVRPAIARLAGRSEVVPRTLTARLTQDFQHRGQRPSYRPARLFDSSDGLRIEPLASRGSGDLAALIAANALAIFPAGDRLHPAGDTVEAIRL